MTTTFSRIRFCLGADAFWLPMTLRLSPTASPSSEGLRELANLTTEDEEEPDKNCPLMLNKATDHPPSLLDNGFEWMMQKLACGRRHSHGMVLPRW